MCLCYVYSQKTRKGPQNGKRWPTGGPSKGPGDNLSREEESGKEIRVGEGEMRKNQKNLYVKNAMIKSNTFMITKIYQETKKCTFENLQYVEIYIFKYRKCINY